MVSFFDKVVDDENAVGVCLRQNHLGKILTGGYIITEQYPFGCLAVNYNQKLAETITTHNRKEKLTIGYIDRKWIPLCELEEFA